MDIVIPSVIIGVVSAILTEILKLSFFKILEYEKQKLIAFLIAVICIGVYVLSVQVPSSVQEWLAMIVISISASYGIWKTIFKPLEVLYARIKAGKEKSESVEEKIKEEV